MQVLPFWSYIGSGLVYVALEMNASVTDLLQGRSVTRFSVENSAEVFDCNVFPTRFSVEKRGHVSRWAAINPSYATKISIWSS